MFKVGTKAGDAEMLEGVRPPVGAQLCHLLKWLSGKNPPANKGDIRAVGSIPGSGRSPGVGNGNPLQYSCLENSVDREA